MPSQSGSIRPFQTAFWCVALALGLPAVAFMFGMIRVRQLQSVANPRWATFARDFQAQQREEVQSPPASKPESQHVAQRPGHSSASVPFRDRNDVDLHSSVPTAQKLPQTVFTGSVTGRHSIDSPVSSHPIPPAVAEAVRGHSNSEIEELPPIVFRPLDEDSYPKPETPTAEATQRLEIQLAEVRQQLRQLTSRQHERQLEDRQRETQLLDALAKLNDQKQTRKRFDVPETRLAQLPLPDEDEFSGPPAPAPPTDDEDLSPEPAPSFVPEAEMDDEPVVEPAKEPEVEFEPPFETPSEPAEKPAAEPAAEPAPARDHEPEFEPETTESAPPAPSVTEPKTSTPKTPELKTPELKAPSRSIPESRPTRGSDEPFREPAPASPKFADNSPPVDEGPIRIRRTDSTGPYPVYTIDIENADIRQVFARLSGEAQISLCPSADIQGLITLHLRDVPIHTALNAIIKSRHYIIEQDAQIYFIRTPDEMARARQETRKVVMKIYQPNYISASELNRLIVPLLSSEGRQSVAPPAAEGLGETNTSPLADTSGQNDLVVVQDYPEVLAQIDQVLVDVDVPPLQVGIEAKILRVRLSESLQHGVDLSLLPCQQDLGTMYAEGGLKQGRLSCNVPTFIKSMERLADTSVISSQRIQVSNKHRAEMLIGDRIGYQSQAGGEIRFMEAGTRLILRPSVSADGLIRLDIHPEYSSATVNKKLKAPVQNTTELTTQVLIRNGATVAIGGLISEQVVDTGHRIPKVGSLPIIGAPFRHKRDRLQRTELIVLVTPRILVDCENEVEGPYLQQVAESRAAEFRDSRSHHSRQQLARAHYERACAEFQSGNLVKAHLQIHASLRENKGDTEALRLRDQIHAGLMQHTVQ
ncbi:hypothetical protein [Schlesneria sp. DSM 10557]|uniref:hypothetical protein n=1 Tax=Schlesneria sp. DSM 10557 TaxID=3044399 RepID=UPI00359FD506